MNSRAAISLLPSPSHTSRTTSSSAGVSAAQPVSGRCREPRPRVPYLIASSTLIASPSAQADSNSLAGNASRNLPSSAAVAGLVNREAHHSSAAPDRSGRSQQPSGLAMGALIADGGGQTLESIGHLQIRPGVGDASKCPLGVTLERRPGGPATSDVRARTTSPYAKCQPAVTAIASSAQARAVSGSPRATAASALRTRCPAARMTCGLICRQAVLAGDESRLWRPPPPSRAVISAEWPMPCMEPPTSVSAAIAACAAARASPT